jgi:threonine synthase
LRPDWYVQAIGSGTGAYAFYKGFFELQKLGVVEKIPNILCVQPEGCSPMVNAFKRGCESLQPEFVVSKPSTFVNSLTNGNPSSSYPYVRSVVVKSGGYMESVSESEIGRALVLLAKLEGILVEPAAAVALAGLAKCVDEGIIDKHSKILLNVSGGLRKLVKRNLSVGAKQRHPLRAPSLPPSTQRIKPKTVA